MNTQFCITFIACLFGSFDIATAQLENLEDQSKVDVFFEEIISGEKDSEILRGFSALKKHLPYSGDELLEQLLASVFRSQSEVEFALKKQAWVTAAREQPSAAALSSSIMLSEVEEEIRVKTLTGMMLDSDYPPNSEEDWNLDKYFPIFKATQEDPFYRLVVYAYEAAPDKALEMMLELYGENIPAEERKNIIRKAEEIVRNLRQHDQLFGEGERVDGIVDFFVGLTKFDEWYLDLFIAVCLKKDRLENVSTKLNQYFSSKPESLASKMRQGETIASLPPQKISLESLKDDQVNERENRLRDNNPSDLRTQEVTRRANEKNQKQQEVSEPQKSPSRLPWIIVGAVLLGLLFLLKALKGKSTS